MSLRDDLMEGGWCQGAIIQSSLLPKIKSGPYDYAIILSQTCDVLSHNTKYDPDVELLPLKILPNRKPDKKLYHSYNPRRIQFKVCKDDKEVWAESAIRDCLLYDREKLPEIHHTSEIQIAPGTLHDLCVWRAARYLRHAFPDDFEENFKTSFKENPDDREETTVSNEFQKLMEEHQALINRLMIHYEPDSELEEGEGYEIKIVLFPELTTKAVPGQIEQIQDLRNKMAGLLKRPPGFQDVTVTIGWLDEFSLWDASNYLDWSRYDYLSFGDSD